MILVTVREGGYPDAIPCSFANDGLRVFFCAPEQSPEARNLDHSEKVALYVNQRHLNGKVEKRISMTGRAIKITDKRKVQDAQVLLTSRDERMNLFMPNEPGEVSTYRIDPMAFSVILADPVNDGRLCKLVGHHSSFDL